MVLKIKKINAGLIIIYVSKLGIVTAAGMPSNSSC